MGHGDEIVLADANFPSVSHANRILRADGHGIPKLLAAILPLFPLDTYVPHASILMEMAPQDNFHNEVWDEYSRIIERYQGGTKPFEFIDRYSFYERAAKAFAVVATGEQSLYANIILKKGVIKNS